MHACVYACVGPRSALGVIPPVPSTLLFDTPVSCRPGPHVLGYAIWLVSFWDQPVSVSLAVGLQSQGTMPDFFIWALGIRLSMKAAHSPTSLFLTSGKSFQTLVD